MHNLAVAYVAYGNFFALFVMGRIAARGEHYAHARAVVPLNLYIGEPAVGNGLEYVHQVGSEHRQNNLRFGVAEAGVVFHHLHTLVCAHKAEVQAALERSALGVHCVHRGNHYGVHNLFFQLLRPEGAGREGAHSASVEALVAVERALVVARGYHRHDCFAVGKGEHGYLFAGGIFEAAHTLFDYYFIASGTEGLVEHNALQALFCLFERIAYEHALAEGEAVGLQNYGRALFAQVGEGLFVIFENFRFGGGYAVLFHQIFGKRLARFDYRRIFAGAEAALADIFERVDEADCEGVVGGDYVIVDFGVSLCILDDGGDIHIVHVYVFGNLRGARVALHTIEFFNALALFKREQNGVFSAAVANY